MILHSELASVHSERDCVIKEKASHDYHLESILQNPEILKSTYGVTLKCPVESLQYFSDVGSFPPDIMHDILEGVLPNVILVVLNHFNSTGILSLREFSTRLSDFQVGGNDKGYKPVEIPSGCLGESTFPGKAIEEWCLSQILPFVVHDQLKDDDPFWDMFLLL